MYEIWIVHAYSLFIVDSFHFHSLSFHFKYIVVNLQVEGLQFHFRDLNIAFTTFMETEYKIRT